ncbi:MAG: FAD-dependent monooxygenase, partial [Thermoplasmatales archaeon]|nr:FAD-dependent monooxygenase [Thermoplasmatales archaeon]
MLQFPTGNLVYLECDSGSTMKYDVVIVGAGPSGSTVAKCLAEKGVKAL